MECFTSFCRSYGSTIRMLADVIILFFKIISKFYLRYISVKVPKSWSSSSRRQAIFLILYPLALITFQFTIFHCHRVQIYIFFSLQRETSAYMYRFPFLFLYLRHPVLISTTIFTRRNQGEINHHSFFCFQHSTKRRVSCRLPWPGVQ